MIALMAYKKAYELNNTEETDNNKKNYLFTLGKEYLKTENFEDAVKSFQKSLDTYQNDDINEIMHYLALSYDKNKQYNEAIEAYNKLLNINYCSELEDFSSSAVDSLAKIHIKMGNNKEAVNTYKKYIELNPAVWSRITKFYDEDKKEYIEIIEAYNEMIKENPNNNEYYYYLSELYKEIKEYDKAIELYNKAIEINPDDFSYYLSIADLYEEIKEYDKAVEMLKKSIEKDSDNIETYITLGNLYEKLGNTSERDAIYKKAIEVCDDDGYSLRQT